MKVREMTTTDFTYMNDYLSLENIVYMIIVLIFVAVLAWFGKIPNLIPIILAGIIMFAVLVFYKNDVKHISTSMVETIETSNNVSDLKPMEMIPVCNENFVGFLTAATWTQGSNNKVGVIFGKPIDGGCQYTIKSVDQ